VVLFSFWPKLFYTKQRTSGFHIITKNDSRYFIRVPMIGPLVVFLGDCVSLWLKTAFGCGPSTRLRINYAALSPPLHSIAPCVLRFRRSIVIGLRGRVSIAGALVFGLCETMDSSFAGSSRFRSLHAVWRERVFAARAASSRARAFHRAQRSCSVRFPISAGVRNVWTLFLSHCVVRNDCRMSTGFRRTLL